MRDVAVCRSIVKSGSNQVTAAKGVSSSGARPRASPLEKRWKQTPELMTISPSRWLKVPSPKSPCSSNSAMVTLPSYIPSSRADMVDVWYKAWATRRVVMHAVTLPMGKHRSHPLAEAPGRRQ